LEGVSHADRHPWVKTQLALLRAAVEMHTKAVFFVLQVA